MDSGVSSGAGWPHFLSLSNETSLPTTTTIILSTPTPQHALELSVNSYSFSISCQSLPMHTLLQRTSPTLPSRKPHLFQRTRYEGLALFNTKGALFWSPPSFPDLSRRDLASHLDTGVLLHFCSSLRTGFFPCWLLGMKGNCGTMPK